MKIVNSSPISAFGGLNFVLRELDSLGVDVLLQKHLPKLPSQSIYSWKDILYSFWSIFFCSGDCSEDISIHLKDTLNNTPFVKAPSPDRILNRMKELAEPSMIFGTPRGSAKHEFSINPALNKLNIRLLKKFGAFNQKEITLDYDNTLLYTQKKDAVMTFKKQFGYAPGVGLIGNNIVYVENRNGNSAAQNLQEDTLERMFLLLQEHGVKVDKFRADGASYYFSPMSVIKKYVSNFYIRARMNDSLSEAINQVNNWKKIELGGEIVEIGSVLHKPFEKIASREKVENSIGECRLIITKVKRKDGQYNVFTGEAYSYHGILTNDVKSSSEQIINFYNQRGASEREFDVLKNDFGWNKMPFSKLEYNAAFLILTAMCRNIYHYIITKFSGLYRNLAPNYRLKKFIFRFICMPAKWVKSSRTYKLRLYGNISFKT